MKKTRKLLTLTALGGLLAPGAYAQFNKLEAWGDAAGTTPAPSFTSGGGASTISAGGADFWGGSDQGAYLWDTNGNMTRTGDFTASVRHISTNSPAPEWGRDGILVRAISGGAPDGSKTEITASTAAIANSVQANPHARNRASAAPAIPTTSTL